MFIDILVSTMINFEEMKWGGIFFPIGAIYTRRKERQGKAYKESDGPRFRTAALIPTDIMIYDGGFIDCNPAYNKILMFFLQGRSSACSFFSLCIVSLAF